MPRAGFWGRIAAFWPSWFLVLMVLIATSLAIKSYNAGNHKVADFSSIAGTGLSAAGFILTIAAVMATRTAYEARAEEKLRSERGTVRSALEAARTSIQTVRQDFGRTEGWKEIPAHLQALVEQLLEIDRNLPMLQATNPTIALDESIVKGLQQLVWSYHNGLRKNREPTAAAPKAQKLLSELEVQLSRFGVDLERGAES